MTSPFVPLVSPTELGTFLGDSTINTLRAAMMIEQAQTLCQRVVNPLPAGAEIVVMRVAARAYSGTMQARYAQSQAAGAAFGGMPRGDGGVHLEAEDEEDIRGFAGGGGAFSIDLLPTGYTAPPSGYVDPGFDTIP